MPGLIQVWRFYCDYCDHSNATLKAITAHERTCWRNPQRRACLTCEHYCIVECGHPDRPEWREVCDSDADIPLEDGIIHNCWFWEAGCNAT